MSLSRSNYIEGTPCARKWCTLNLTGLNVLMLVRRGSLDLEVLVQMSFSSPYIGLYYLRIELSPQVCSQVYATPPPTLQDLQRRITDTWANVTPAVLHREVQARVQMCIVAHGEKFEHRK
ncbi:hypothetical protein AVEN_34669-1 [Araneus ventricosus]|uniref:Uncharacterized protein n=1 Tax=Araneus ventricosus TaxID=182803 RepID=A0A4Y2B2E3_ARAVE|nr:hypothetical protein AVEN_34669-1 [Araneus ventricosus]